MPSGTGSGPVGAPTPSRFEAAISFGAFVLRADADGTPARGEWSEVLTLDAPLGHGDRYSESSAGWRGAGLTTAEQMRRFL